MNTLVDLFDQKKKEMGLRNLELIISSTSWDSEFEYCPLHNHKIVLGRKDHNEVVLHHELRHAWLAQEFPKLRSFLEYMRGFYRKYDLLVFFILSAIAIVNAIVSLMFSENYNFVITPYLILLCFLFNITLWLEELDANMFAFKNTKKVMQVFLHQWSYSIHFLFTTLCIIFFGYIQIFWQSI